MPQYQSSLSFLGGEVSPYLSHRIDLDKHAQSAEQMENFLPMPFGGIRKRPGTTYLNAVTWDQYKKPRLQAFSASNGDRFVFCFTGFYLYIYSPAGGSPVYSQYRVMSDPKTLQFQQIGDILYIADTSSPPWQVSYDGSSFVVSEVSFSWIPLLPENVDPKNAIKFEPASTVYDDTSNTWTNSTIYFVGDLVKYLGNYYRCITQHVSDSSNSESLPPSTTGTSAYWRFQSNIPVGWIPEGTKVSLSSSEVIFQASQIGSQVQQNAQRNGSSFETSVAGTSAFSTESKALTIQGKWSFLTSGIWVGTFTIQRSMNLGQTWEDLRTFTGNKDRNLTAEGEEPKRCMMRIKPAITAVTNNARATLTSEEAFLPGLVKISTVNSNGKSATGIAMTPIERQTTTYWSFSAFSSDQGYPAAVALHDSRLVFGGTKRRPLGLWLSKTDDFLNFQTGTDDDSSIYMSLASSGVSPIRWITSQRRMIVGTEESEWVFGSDTSDAPISPSNLLVRIYSKIGSAECSSIVMGESLFFLERQRRRLREYSYMIERESYSSADLTRLAEHITESGIIQFCWQQNREPVMWAVLENGSMLSFSYNRDEKIASWARHTTQDGLFLSACVLRNSADDDDVYALVWRFGNRLHLEKLEPSQQAYQEQDVVSSTHHVDCGFIRTPTAVTGDGVTTYRITLDSWMNGREVIAYSSGNEVRLTVSGGMITVPWAGETHIGFPIISKLKTLPIEVQAENGFTLGRMKRANAVRLNVYKSQGGSIQAEDETLPLPYPDHARHTGWLEKNVRPPAHDQDLSFTILHDSAQPFTITAASVEWTLYED